MSFLNWVLIILGLALMRWGYFRHTIMQWPVDFAILFLGAICVIGGFIKTKKLSPEEQESIRAMDRAMNGLPKIIPGYPPDKPAEKEEFQKWQ